MALPRVVACKNYPQNHRLGGGFAGDRSARVPSGARAGAPRVFIAPALARTPTPTAGLGKVTTSIMLPYVTPSGRAQTLRRPGITAGSSSSDQGR